MKKYRMTANVVVTLHYNSKTGVELDYTALNMRFNHVKSNMLKKGDDITMQIKVEKVEENG